MGCRASTPVARRSLHPKTTPAPHSQQASSLQTSNSGKKRIHRVQPVSSSGAYRGGGLPFERPTDRHRSDGGAWTRRRGKGFRQSRTFVADRRRRTVLSESWTCARPGDSGGAPAWEQLRQNKGHRKPASSRDEPREQATVCPAAKWCLTVGGDRCAAFLVHPG